jgi:hypothetical protein
LLVIGLALLGIPLLCKAVKEPPDLRQLPGRSSNFP